MTSSPDRGAEPNTGPGAVPAGHIARQALANVDRDTRAKMLAAIARRFGDLELAEDAVQEAFVKAMASWPRDGIPDTPAAWLTTTARRKALDAVRRGRVLERKLPRLRVQEAAALQTAPLQDPAEVFDDEDEPVGDDRLGLFFACAHPVLRPDDRVALTLRFVGGLTTVEDANRLLVPVATMQQRIRRAKKRILAHGISFQPPRPAQLPQRLADVQRVIYLVFAEGFSRSTGGAHIRDDLTAEAIRLARLLHRLLPGSAEVTGLLGLLLLTEARRPARTNGTGHPVPLAEQDRSRWTQALIAEGICLTQTAAASPGAGSYAIQAAIAAVHAESASFAQTDWAQIEKLYRMLQVYEPGPVVRLGHAVAWGQAHGLKAGLKRLDELADDPVLSQFRPFHVTRAITLTELERHEQAAAAYRRALALGGNDAEHAFLLETLAALER